MKKDGIKKLLNFLAILIVFGVTFSVVFVFFQPASIKGNSMYPTYKNGDIVFINTAENDYAVNDVIVMLYGKEKIIKRIRGTSGDRIDITEKGVFINDVFIIDNQSNYSPNNYILSENQYFVMGDNYTESTDSRYFGPITSERIIGKVLFAKDATTAASESIS